MKPQYVNLIKVVHLFGELVRGWQFLSALYQERRHHHRTLGLSRSVYLVLIPFLTSWG